MMLNRAWLLFLCAVMLCVDGTVAYAQDASVGVEADSARSQTVRKFTFALDIGTERREGYTEYEIDVGWVPVQPYDVVLKAGSRLRFPVNSILTRLGATAAYAGFSLSATAWLQLSNSEGLFKDYDWFELNKQQNSFIFGSARNNDKSKQFDFEASYTARTKSMTFTPRIRLSLVNMSFEAEDATQWQYYGFDDELGLVPLDEPYVFDTTALVITYEIDYTAFYFGGSFAYRFPFGVEAELMGMFAPIVSADDLDIHLLREPPKKAETSSDGSAGIAGLRLTYKASRIVEVFGGVDYSFFKTDGTQKQTELGEPYQAYTGIPAETKSEWYSISGGLTLYLGR